MELLGMLSSSSSVCVCVFVCDGGAVREGERQKERLRQSESSNEGTGNWRMLGSFPRK